MLQAIIESFVVAEVEPLLLQLPFQVPICLGYEEEAGVRLLDGGDHVKPILCRRSCSCARSPGSLKDRIHQQHRHVTAHAVALAGDARECRKHSQPKPWLKGIELQY